MLEVQSLIEKGFLNRQTASNNVNEHSSRSHLVIIVKIERESRKNGEKLLGVMQLVDLAGKKIFLFNFVLKKNSDLHNVD